ncbi:ABC transporter ATP-binding protein [Butyrivibrio sp. CB08]|uniref:ABC transporter ATP-binding protein n=1 Tax=Butyrivibrio sp. CB08 TaxID=2364879 RepID=UPI000EA96146|nr:ABC transporter ATP-binding protein [Butyrivibrio sp. CB08]RKM56206.1 ABC transporter ATP-binding protein [Butyrivibrio sp. CB08]
MTKGLSERQGVLSRLTGTNMAIANMLILISDIVMLFVCTWFYQNGQVGFDGFLIPLIALMSSFGPVTALAALGTTLQSTVASGARVLAIVDEEPETKDITDKAPIDFEDAEVKDVSFSYAGEIMLVCHMSFQQ